MSVNREMRPTLGNGKVCYIEIPARDLRLSSSFYKNVLGWQIRQRRDGSLAFDDGVGEVSGTWVVGRKPATDPGLLIYIMVDSVAATLESVVKPCPHGGFDKLSHHSESAARACRGQRQMRRAMTQWRNGGTTDWPGCARDHCKVC